MNLLQFPFPKGVIFDQLLKNHGGLFVQSVVCSPGFDYKRFRIVYASRITQRLSTAQIGLLKNSFKTLPRLNHLILIYMICHLSYTKNIFIHVTHKNFQRFEYLRTFLELYSVLCAKDDTKA